MYKASMVIKNMYVFSDTAADNLIRSKVCGIGILEGATGKQARGRQELRISLKPLIIGVGGLGQSIEDGWWDFNKGALGDKSAL
jgi:hypothetical protein